MTDVNIALNAAGEGRVQIGGQDVQIRSAVLRLEAGHVPQLVIERDAFDVNLQIEGAFVVDPAARLAAIKRFHDEWGETDGEDLDPLALWEDLGRLLRGES